MKRKNSNTILTLMFVCTLLIALSVPVVYADKTGIGKFLTVEFLNEGQGDVIAIKYSSGEIFTFEWDDPNTHSQKVGAGTVYLTPLPEEGWEFSRWGEDLEGASYPPETAYKTRKNGRVVAVFVKTSFTITVTANNIGNGFGTGEGTIDGQNYLEVIKEYGESAAFNFVYDDDTDHVSSIKVNEDYIDIVDKWSYTIPVVTKNYDIIVTFDEIGKATVPPGASKVFLGEGAELEFFESAGGVVIGEEIVLGISDPDYSDFPALWNIIIDSSSYEGRIFIKYDDTQLPPNPDGSPFDETLLRLIHGDSVYAVRSDVNFDDEVDGTDVSIVANAVKEKEDWYDPLYDIDNNGVLDEHDIHIVNENKGTFLTDVTGDRDTVDNIIWSIPIDDNAGFGVRR